MLICSFDSGSRYRLVAGRSESQTALAGAVGEGRDAAVEAVPAAIEDAGLDTRLLRALGEQLAGPLRPLRGVELAQVVLGPARLRRSCGHGRRRSAGRRARGWSGTRPAAGAPRCRGSSPGRGGGGAAFSAVVLTAIAYARLPTLRRTCSSA